MTTYNNLRQAFLTYKETHGSAAARKLAMLFGSEDGTLDCVPERRWTALASAFNSGDDDAPVTSGLLTADGQIDTEAVYRKRAADARKGRPDSTVAAGELDAAGEFESASPASLDEIHSRAYQKWNSAGKRES